MRSISAFPASHHRVPKQLNDISKVFFFFDTTNAAAAGSLSTHAHDLRRRLNSNEVRNIFFLLGNFHGFT